MMNKRKNIIMLAFLVFIVYPLHAYGAKGALSSEAQMCLGCHLNKRLTKQLESKEILPLYVDGNEFANSIHNYIGCAGCHMDISMANHPKVKKIKTRKIYARDASKACVMCHPDKRLKKRYMHGKVVAHAKAPSCAECHGSHYVKSISEWKAIVTGPQYCLTCHKYDLTTSLKSGELLHLSVDKSAFKSSVHGNLSCSVCHMGFSKSEHPVRVFKSRKEYTTNASKACFMCHPDEQLRKKPTHRSLMAKVTCVECHGSHFIMGVFAQRTTLKENQYCLSCHAHALSMRLKNGKLLSLSVDGSLLRSSMHGKLQCHDCHVGFSTAKHPTKVYNSKRAYSIVVGGECGKCHSEADKQYKQSIHCTLLKEGNLWAPLCTDCHSFHSVAKADKNLGLLSCNKCHGDINAVYASSIHNIARVKGREDAPVCSSCHGSHDVRVTTMTMEMKEACLTCHKDTEGKHKRWLNNPPFKLSSFAGLHFDTVSCAACHSPDAKRGIYLMLYDRKTGKPFPEEELFRLLETDSAGLKRKFDANGDASIDASELWNIFEQSYTKGVVLTFMGKMDVQKGTEAHQIAAKSEAVRECEKCHHPNSEFFKDTSIVISRTDGRPIRFNAKQEVLGSVFSIVPVSKFYALGSTNVRLLDILFIIAVLGGIAVPIGHLTVRIITSPIRSLRKMGKGGKK